ncbi:MAG: hypothetical protein ABUL48_00005 [Pseudorhodoplanes sp.]
MPRALKIILVFIAGLVAGEGIPILIYIISTNYFGFHDMDGGTAMGTVFMIGPLCAVVVAVIATIIAIIKL